MIISSLFLPHADAVNSHNDSIDCLFSMNAQYRRLLIFGKRFLLNYSLNWMSTRVKVSMFAGAKTSRNDVVLQAP